MNFFLVFILILATGISRTSYASSAGEEGCGDFLEPNTKAKLEVASAMARMMSQESPILRMSLPLLPYQDDLDIGDRLVRIGILAKGTDSHFRQSDPDMIRHVPSSKPPIKWFAVSDDANRAVMTFHRSYFEPGMDGEEKSLNIFVADILRTKVLKHYVEFALPNYGEARGGFFVKRGSGLFIEGLYSQPTEMGREEDVLGDLYFYQLMNGEAKLVGRLSQSLNVVIQRVTALPNNNPRVKTYALTLAADKLNFMAIAVDIRTGQIEVLARANLEKASLNRIEAMAYDNERLGFMAKIAGGVHFESHKFSLDVSDLGPSVKSQSGGSSNPWLEEVRALIGAFHHDDFDMHADFVAQAASGRGQEPTIEIYPRTQAKK